MVTLSCTRTLPKLIDARHSIRDILSSPQGPFESHMANYLPFCIAGTACIRLAPLWLILRIHKPQQPFLT